MNNEIVYITKSSLSEIVNSINLPEHQVGDLNLYLTDLSKVFSTQELVWLTKYRELLKDPEKLLTSYKKSNRRDSKKWVFESSDSVIPRYHNDFRCTFLTKEFNNIELPVEILQLGDEKIAEFRIFFKDKRALYERDPVAFMGRAKTKFQLKNEPIPVKFNNSGIESFANMSEKDLEQAISDLLILMEKLRTTNANSSKVISSFGYATHKLERILSYPIMETIDPNGRVITQWHNHKSTLKLLLREYFGAKFNPEFSFKTSLLTQLKFKTCKICEQTMY